jgi:hypothetical protein
MYAWNGCLVNTVPSNADLAADCIYKCFEMKKEKAKRLYLDTVGVSFKNQLMEIFPICTDAHKKCVDMYAALQVGRVYRSPANFPETVKTVKAIADNFDDFTQVISSTAEECFIEKWALKNDLTQYFFRIYGYEHGHKNMHISAVRSIFPGAEIVFVSSSARDMKLRADCRIAVQAGENRDSFVSQGANAVISGPIIAEKIVSALCKNL